MGDLAEEKGHKKQKFNTKTNRSKYCISLHSLPICVGKVLVRFVVAPAGVILMEPLPTADQPDVDT